MRKRTIEELQNRYKRVPETLTDIYVEGLFDKNLLDWFFSQTGNKTNKVYTIDSVEIPDDLVESYGLTKRSNKNKVIVLANELKKSLTESARLIGFIVDKDLDGFIERPNCFDTELILSTDFVSMDLYLITTDSLKKYLTFYGACTPDASEIAASNIFFITKNIFAARLALAESASSVGLVSYDKCLFKAESNKLGVDLEKLIHRSLEAVGSINIKSELMTSVTTWLNKFQQEGLDPRACTHGRDAFEVLRWVASSGNSKPLASKAESVQAAFLMTISASNLATYSLFKRYIPSN